MRHLPSTRPISADGPWDLFVSVCNLFSKNYHDDGFAFAEALKPAESNGIELLLTRTVSVD
jgi:hypothetical protein